MRSPKQQQPPTIHDCALCFELDNKTSSWAAFFSSLTLHILPFSDSCLTLVRSSSLLCLQILNDDTVLKVLEITSHLQ